MSRHKWLALVFALLCAAKTAFGNEDSVFDVKLPAANGKEILISGTRQDLYGYAQTFIDRGDTAYAQICYEHLIENDPRDVKAYILLGKLYQFNLEKYPKAINCYKKAERLVPAENKEGKILCGRLVAEAFRALAEKSNSLIYFVQAINEYEKILEYDPKDAEVMYYLASCRLNTNDFNTAISLFQKVVNEFPQSEWARWSKKGLEYAKREKARKGESDSFSSSGRNNRG